LSINKVKDIGIQTISNEELNLDNLLFNNPNNLDTISLREEPITTPEGNIIIRNPNGEVLFGDEKYPKFYVLKNLKI